MRSSRGLLARVALLTPFAVLAPAAQRPASQQIYTISIGDSRHAVSSGTLWLYSYSWYGLQQIELANVVHGRSVVRLDTGRLRGELNPNPTTDGYVIALQVGEHGWFRTANLAPDAFWNNLLSEIDSLGQATASSNGDKQLVLPAPAHRRLTLLYPDGSPAADQTITLSIYLWDTNHCGFHEGLPLGTFRTDKTGTVEVTAPLVPLYLDGISYYEEVEGTGLAGPAYSNNTGLKTSPAADLILKKKWVFTDDDNEGIDAELRVATQPDNPGAA